jgi:hypothetical protein
MGMATSLLERTGPPVFGRVAENPASGRSSARFDSTPEDQLNVSPGDKLFRQELVEHGLKGGTADSLGGCRCYIIDVIKSVERVHVWNKLPILERQRVAEMWGVEGARVKDQLEGARADAENVEVLRDKHSHRWERIAVRVSGYPRRTREAMNLYDEAKGKEAAAHDSCEVPE